ncbi:polysaccharide pyruvyl transferase family protein [Amedibacillus dolichus]|uniref:polysaccharide pyruvyl transferase family protein n=1 Tax=Amedibacillus dolichus TaxID=31971 RepID=UPI0026713E9F|nr:polysaccharide pyruvyl transferase family protein [Amedibacillus dolichus]
MRFLYLKKRKESFEDFNNNYLNFSEKVYPMNAYNELNNEKYEIYSVGSDQVWNTYFDEFSEVFLLNCLDETKIRISYAASLGCESINPIYKDKFKNELKKFKAISVRENEGKKLIESLENVSVEIVLDPTLLLGRNEWDALINEHKFSSKEDYILTYFLGEMESDMKRCIKKYAKEKKMKIIDLNKVSTNYYSVGPIEFVSLIKNAKMVFTDSFHACCFSIIYGKQFWVVTRNSVKKSMNTRINTLLENLNLESQWWDKETNLEEGPNFENAYKKLEELKKQSFTFLKKAVDME